MLNELPMAPKRLTPSPVQQKLKQAFSFHKQGRLGEARKAYEEILKENSTRYVSLHMLGVIALQTKRPKDAEGLFPRAIAVSDASSPG